MNGTGTIVALLVVVAVGGGALYLVSTSAAQPRGSTLLNRLGSFLNGIGGNRPVRRGFGPLATPDNTDPDLCDGEFCLQ